MPKARRAPRKTTPDDHAGLRGPVNLPTPPIAEFSIQGLFGDRDVSVSFKSGAKVLVGDNGSGKTTVLNCLFYVLTGRFHRLSAVPFKRILVRFSDGMDISIERDELPNPFAWALQAPRLADFKSGLGSEAEFLDFVKGFAESANENDFYTFASTRDYQTRTSQNPFLFYREPARAWDSWNRSDKRGTDLSDSLRQKKQGIQESFPFPILFLPTYRRVEEEMANLGLHLGRGRPASSGRR